MKTVRRNNVKIDAISLRRRHLMIAGVAGVAAPVTLFAEPRNGNPRDALVTGLSASAGSGADKLVVSGRILDAKRNPLADATVEVWQADTNGERASVMTDADGRFFTSIAPGGQAGRPQHIRYRVSHNGRATSVKQLHFTRETGFPADRVAQLQRDDTGTWRTTFGITLA
jgi:protocatechuate 3,4-dioxygenase beta subunit